MKTVAAPHLHAKLENINRNKSDFYSFSKKLYFILLVTLLPLASPSLPGNTILVDFVNVVFIFLFAILLSIKKKPLDFPLFGPVLIIFLGSMMALYNAQALTTSIFTISQDLYLFVFFLFLYNLIDHRDDLKLLLVLWILVGISEAVLAILNTYAHVSIGSSKVSASEDFTRARATFGNSDAAASYFGVSFFLIFQPYFPLKTFWRMILGLFFFIGLLETKSMSALLSITTGGLIVYTLYWLYVKGKKKLQLTLSALLVIVITLVFIIPKLMQEENFLDRGPRSASTRMEIWEAGYISLTKHPMGIGPGAFKKVGQGPYNREGKRAELHSDYISHLVERGPLGFIGLLMLYGTLVLLIMNKLTITKSSQEYLWLASLLGLMCFILIDALNHEGMHYRHVWFVFAIIAVQKKMDS